MCSEPKPFSRAVISVYTILLCVGVSTDGVPYHFGPGLDGNDPLWLRCLYSFI